MHKALLLARSSGMRQGLVELSSAPNKLEQDDVGCDEVGGSNSQVSTLHEFVEWDSMSARSERGQVTSTEAGLRLLAAGYRLSFYPGIV